MRACRRSAAGTVLVLAVLVACSPGCSRKDAATPDEMRAKIQALEQELPVLRSKLGELVATDRRLEGMPTSGVRVGVPTPLARDADRARRDRLRRLR